MDPRISVVIATRNRRATLARTLDRLLALPESPPVIVVDNASTDGTAEFVREGHPRVRLIALPQNLGAAARTVGVEAAEAPYIAFCDDDSWWEPGALARISDGFDAHPRLAVIAARVLVGPEGILDPTCVAMAASPLPGSEDLPGPSVLGFVACGAAVRRAAFLQVGGFERRFGIGSEEGLLAIDLASAGWSLAYLDEAVAYHHPDVSGPRPGRRRIDVRNELWSVWLRRPLPAVIGRTARALTASMADPDVRLGLLDALKGIPWIARSRRVIPRHVEKSLRRLGH